MANDDDFDWSPLGREFWIEIGRSLGASDRQIRFSASKFRGTSNTRAAEEAGYQASTDGGLRSTGYRLFRANVTQQLLAAASAESGGTGPDGSVTRDEARRILSALARGSDPSVKIRAVEQLSKFDEADRQQRNAEVTPDPQEVAGEILRSCPTMGAAVLADCHLAQTGRPWGMPYLRELSPIIRKDFPVLWNRMRESITDQVQRLEFETYASGPLLRIDQIIGPEPETKSKEEVAQ